MASKSAAKLKLKWKVGAAPTGRYRSFETRSWPSAKHDDGRPAAYLDCDLPYKKSATTMDGVEITVRVADWSAPSNTMTGEGFTWRKLKRHAVSLAEAKLLAARFLERHPEFTIYKGSMRQPTVHKP